MALTAAWMAVCDMLGVKTQTLGPNVAMTASGQRLADGEGYALAPPAVAVSAAAPKTTALTRRRTARCMKAPHCAEIKRGNIRQGACARERFVAKAGYASSGTAGHARRDLRSASEVSYATGYLSKSPTRLPTS